MISFNLLIPLICAFSVSPSNTLPQYSYCSDVHYEAFLPSSSFVDNTLDDPYSLPNDFKVEYDAKLYFNDVSNWTIKDFNIHYYWNLYADNEGNMELVDDIDDYVFIDSYSLTSSNLEDYDINITYQVMSNSNYNVAIDFGSNHISNRTYIGYGYNIVHNYGYSITLDNSYLLNQITSYITLSSGYNDGYNDGYNSGYSEGFDDGNSFGYQDGYVAGYDNASTQNQTAVTIFSGIISVGLIPINFFLACLNFEVFGINIGSFVSALLTIAIVVIITRMIVSGGNGGGDK